MTAKQAAAWLYSMSLSILLIVMADGAEATTVTWESGTISGTVDQFSGVASGSFSFDMGDNDVSGVDYSSANPGSFSATFMGSQTGTWSGGFSATDIILGLTSGTFAHETLLLADGNTLDLFGPITFSVTAPTPPLPSDFSDLAFSGQMILSNVGGQFFDFSGPFQLTATVIPEPAIPTLSAWGTLLLGSGLLALAAARRRAL